MHLGCHLWFSAGVPSPEQAPTPEARHLAEQAELQADRNRAYYAKNRALHRSVVLRLTEQILFVNTDIQVHIVALQPELINGFFCIFIHCFFNILNVSHDLIMITFQAIWHKECVYNAEKIFF